MKSTVTLLRRQFSLARSASILASPLAVVLAIALAFSVAAQPAFADTTPRQFRVVWTENPQTQATVSWTTDDAGTTHAVYFDTESRGGNLAEYASHVAAEHTGRYGVSRRNPHFHHAKLTNLSPATTYFFVAVSDGKISREFHFTTAPDTDVPFRLICGGDSRSDSRKRREINRQIRALATADAGILAIVHGGDYVGDGTDWDEWDEWLDDHQEIVTADGKFLPLVPTRGNHESWGMLYEFIFGYPGHVGRNYFATKFSPAALIVTLNSNISHGGEQLQFLKNTLAANTGVRWQLANYHRPAYPAVKSPGDALHFWVPVFERFDLDLVLESDGHAIKRTVPIRNGRRDETGVVYIGEGGFGVGQRSPERDRWYLKSPGMTQSGHHIIVLAFDAETLAMKIVDEHGRLIDQSLRAARNRAGAGGENVPDNGGNRGGDNAEQDFDGLSAEGAREARVAGCEIGSTTAPLAGAMAFFVLLTLVFLRRGLFSRLPS